MLTNRICQLSGSGTWSTDKWTEKLENYDLTVEAKMTDEMTRA